MTHLDGTTAAIAIAAMGVIASLGGFFLGLFYGLRRIVADVIRLELGWMSEWKANKDEDHALLHRDIDSLRTTSSIHDRDIAVLKDRTR